MKTGTLLIFDEVQTGMGRTGKWFAYQHEGIKPDVMTLAKALGGGVPIGAVVASEEAAQGLTFREGGVVPHASTFGGNPLACAAARCVVKTIESEGLLKKAMETGALLQEALAGLVAKFPGFCVEVRGTGLLQGLVLRTSAVPVVVACRERGVLLSVAGGNVVRFAPALIASSEHIQEGVSILHDVLMEMAE